MKKINGESNFEKNEEPCEKMSVKTEALKLMKTEKGPSGATSELQKVCKNDGEKSWCKWLTIYLKEMRCLKIRGVT